MAYEDKRDSQIIISPEELTRKLSPLFDDEELILIILFGSAATDRTHKRSDIDLAFLYEKPVDILELTNRVIRLLHTDNVDVVDLRKASPLLKFTAVKNGICLYEKNPAAFNVFASLAFRRYVDTKKLRDAQALSIKSFLRERGIS